MPVIDQSLLGMSRCHGARLRSTESVVQSSDYLIHFKFSMSSKSPTLSDGPGGDGSLQVE